MHFFYCLEVSEHLETVNLNQNIREEQGLL